MSLTVLTLRTPMRASTYTAFPALPALFSIQPELGPKGGTGTATAGAPPAGAPPQAGAQQMMPTLLMMGAMMLVFVFMNSRKQKKEEAERANIKKGDRVFSPQSGLIGELVENNGKIAKVKIAPGVTVDMLGSSIASMPEEKPSEKDAKTVADKTAAEGKK